MLPVNGKFKPRVTGDICHTLSVSAVGYDQQFIFLADDAGQDRLHAESAAALHQHSRVFLRGNPGQFQKTGADFLRNLFVIVIPGTVIRHHLLFHRFCGGQRSWCQ